jgi:hypothetical protein
LQVTGGKQAKNNDGWDKAGKFCYHLRLRRQSPSIHDPFALSKARGSRTFIDPPSNRQGSVNYRF